MAITALSSPNTSGPMSPLTAALAAPVVGFIACGVTQPIRSNAVTVAKMVFCFNYFGGVVRWYSGPGQEWSQYGTATSIGESSLSAFTGGGGGLMGAHISFEPK